jgi:uncharacterized protein YqgC (DUF456 family)
VVVAEQALLEQMPLLAKAEMAVAVCHLQYPALPAITLAVAAVVFAPEESKEVADWVVEVMVRKSAIQTVKAPP